MYEMEDLHMRISAKGRYALAAAISMARQYGTGEHITAISISEKLGISKIYLEQVFSLLKRAGLVNTVKGAQGGYALSRAPGEISALDLLMAVETSLFEQAESTASDKAPDIDGAMRVVVFEKLDGAIRDVLSKITLVDLVSEAEKRKGEQPLIYYI